MLNHPMVTFDQEQKEKLLDEVFDGYSDKPIPQYGVSQKEHADMMKKKQLIVATSIIGILVVIGAVVAALVLSSAKANDNTANASSTSGAIVIA